jgi:hypothetical protein
MKMKADWSHMVLLVGVTFLLFGLNVLVHSLKRTETELPPAIEQEREEDEGRVARV